MTEDDGGNNLDWESKITLVYPLVIKHWSVSAPNSYLAGGMSYADGKLTVPITGLYYIYLHAYQNSHGRVYVNVNNIAVAMINAPYPVKPIEQATSHAAGLFNLKENDEISFTSAYDGCVLFMYTAHTFFGAYLLELGIWWILRDNCTITSQIKGIKYF